MLLRWIPNFLTISRCGLAFLVLLACVKVTYAQGCESEHFTKEDCNNLVRTWALMALFAFIAGVLTDFFDGVTARILKSESKFGVWLDPIADKLLVAGALVGLSIIYKGWIIFIPTILIVGRDIFITGFRMTSVGKSVVAVSTFAKQKTALEMIAITILLLPLAFTDSNGLETRTDLADIIVGILFVLPLWTAAIMSIISCYQYLKQATKTSD